MVLYYSLSNRKSRGGKINIVRSSPPPGGSMKRSSPRHIYPLYPLTNHPPASHHSAVTHRGRRPTGTSTYTHSDIGLAHARTRGRHSRTIILDYIYKRTHAHTRSLMHVYQRARRTYVCECARADQYTKRLPVCKYNNKVVSSSSSSSSNSSSSSKYK